MSTVSPTLAGVLFRFCASLTLSCEICSTKIGLALRPTYSDIYVHQRNFVSSFISDVIDRRSYYLASSSLDIEDCVSSKFNSDVGLTVIVSLVLTLLLLTLLVRIYAHQHG